VEAIQVLSRDKAGVKEELRHFMLQECDPDIQAQFGPHFYTLEPLLMQIIRELRRRDGLDTRTSEDAV
jgi:hypothetical protein